MKHDKSATTVISQKVTIDRSRAEQARLRIEKAKQIRGRALVMMARLTRTDIRRAMHETRLNPLLESEIHIDEELINLKESFDAYHTAAPTLREYPTLRKHILHERRDIMQHCIGLTARMLTGKRLPYTYTSQDIDVALRRLIAILLQDCRRLGMQLDGDIVTAFRPYLNVRQRMQLRLR